MQIVFLGAARRTGVSSNMEALEASLRHCYPSEREVCFSDCAGRADAKAMIQSSDLLVLNFTMPCSGLEEIFLRYSIVQTNIMFLIGKYFQNRSDELKRLTTVYRIAQNRVCTIPYHPGFENAHARQNFSEYMEKILRNPESYRDEKLASHVKHVLDTIIYYGKRKGEL